MESGEQIFFEEPDRQIKACLFFLIGTVFCDLLIMPFFDLGVALLTVPLFLAWFVLTCALVARGIQKAYLLRSKPKLALGVFIIAPIAVSAVVIANKVILHYFPVS